MTPSESRRVLLDEAYREPFDELIGLLQHREAVVATMVRQAAASQWQTGDAKDEPIRSDRRIMIRSVVRETNG